MTLYIFVLSRTNFLYDEQHFDISYEVASVPCVKQGLEWPYVRYQNEILHTILGANVSC